MENARFNISSDATPLELSLAPGFSLTRPLNKNIVISTVLSSITVIPKII